MRFCFHFNRENKLNHRRITQGCTASQTAENNQNLSVLAMINTKQISLVQVSISGHASVNCSSELSQVLSTSLPNAANVHFIKGKVILDSHALLFTFIHNSNS